MGVYESLLAVLFSAATLYALDIEVSPIAKPFHNTRTSSVYIYFFKAYSKPVEISCFISEKIMSEFFIIIISSVLKWK